MLKEDKNHIIHQYLTGQISDSDKGLLEDWIAMSSKNQAFFDETKEAWEASLSINKNQNWNTNQAWQKFKVANIDADSVEAGSKEAKVISFNWAKWAVAASLLLLVAAGSFYFLNPNDNSILVEANGKNIDYMLPDGSQVDLRDGSSIKYASNFKEKRAIYLSGEAFFDVTPDADHPFIVSTNRVEVEVLGTSFNIDASEERLGETYLYVKEGNVKFKPIKNDIFLSVMAGQKAYLKGKYLDHVKNPNFNAISWHTKELIFDGVAIENAVKDIENHYQVKFDLSKSEINDCSFFAPLPINDMPLENLMEVLKSIYKIEYKIIDDSISIIDGACVMN